jgi:hypothetical protein
VVFSNRPVLLGGGEGAARVAEELRLEEGVGAGAAVDATKGCSRREEASWMSRAIFSLPAPPSPRRSTDASETDTVSAQECTRELLRSDRRTGDSSAGHRAPRLMIMPAGVLSIPLVHSRGETSHVERP